MPLTQVQLSRMQSWLVVSGIQDTNNPLFQVIEQLIKAINEINNSVGSINDLIGPAGPIGPNGIPGFAINSSNGSEGRSLIIPGPRGSDGNAGATGAQGPMGPIMFPRDGIDGRNSYIPGPAGQNGTNGSGAFTLIGQAEGTDSTAASTTVAIIPITGLTVKDSLVVILTMSCVTQAMAQPATITNDTDTVTISTTNQGAGVGAARWIGDYIQITNDQQDNKKVVSLEVPSGSLSSGGSASGSGTQGRESNFTTAWTGNWNLGLKTGVGGVTAGGTLHYRIAVYKLAGQ